MKKPIIILWVIALASTLTSCSDDDQPTPDPVVNYPEYAQLKTGTYWIYENYTTDSSGIFLHTNGIDSCYVANDTIIGGVSYYKVYRKNILLPYPMIEYQRDSLHYIVNEHGRKFFSSKDFSTVFFSEYFKPNDTDTLFYREIKMANNDTLVLVPAGEFTCLNCRTRFDWFQPGRSDSFSNCCYAEKVGIVYETVGIFGSSGQRVERRLLRYHIEEVLYPTK